MRVQPGGGLLAFLGFHHLQHKPVDNQVIGIGFHPENSARKNPDAVFVGFRKNFIRFRKPIGGVPIGRADIDLIPIDLIRQFHEHLGLGDVPIVKFIIPGRVFSGKGVEIYVLKGVGDADQNRTDQQLEHDCGNNEHFEFAPGALHQKAYSGDCQDQYRTVEKIEMSPAVIEDRPPDDREKQEGPNKDDANEEIGGRSRQFFAFHSADKFGNRGNMPEQG